MSFDTNLFNIIHGFVGASGILDVFFVFLAKYLAIILAIIALIFILKRKEKRERFYIFIFSALSILLSRGLFTEIIRFFYEKQRPFEVMGFVPFFSETTHSFPSGHAAFLFALAFSIWCFDKKLGWILFAGAFLNGLGRIFAGMHWPSDIFGGILVSIVSVFIVHKYISSYRPTVLKKEDQEIDVV